MSKIIHCCIDLDYILRRGGAKEMAGMVRLPESDGMATEADILTHATLLAMRGMDAMPTCANHDERGHCKGHSND